jgi:hypothetical protein
MGHVEEKEYGLDCVCFLESMMTSFGRDADAFVWLVLVLVRIPYQLEEGKRYTRVRVDNYRHAKNMREKS